MRNPLLALLLSTNLLLVSGCGDDEPGHDAGADAGHDALVGSDASGVVRFAVNPGEDFYSQPFPCDLRLGDATGIDLTGFPPGEVVVNKMVAAASAYSDGFAVGGVVFFAFSANVDEDSLPAMGAQSMAESSSVFIVDVDPSSPERGTRVPLWLRYKDAPSRFLPANWLGLLPYPGVPLRPGTTYAAVVTRQVRLAEGPSFGPDEDLDAILNDDPRPELSRGRQVFGPLLDWLDEEGLDRSQVAGATVFTTRSSASLLSAARAVIHRDLPLPTLSDLVLVNETANYHLYEGTYQAPIFQQGEPPYRTAGGQIEVDQGGDPVLVRMETLRVGISVPRDVMPSAGWPVAIYRHGTGGDYLSFVSDGTADRLAKAIDSSFQVIGRAAVISIDGVVHGPRAGEDEGSPEERFYNFGNPLAGRDNSRQEAIDNFQLVRLAQSVDVAAAPETGEPIRFDPDGITFFGHSQGAITGALFVPFEPELAAAVLSGAGAHLLLTLLRKESGLDIPTLLELILNDGDYGPIDEFHPVLTLVQTYIEPADPLAYTRYYLREPPEGVGPRNLFLSYGVGDSYTPNITTRVLAAAAGLGPAGSVIDPYEAMELYGEVTPLSPPVCQNLNGAAGPSTAVVVQYQPRYGDDGHFVVFDHMVAKRQSAGFLVTATSTLSATEFEGCATLIP